MTQNTLLLCLVAFVSASIVVLGVTPIVQYLGTRSGRVDRPGTRKIHTQPIVRIGGVAIFIGVLVSLVIAILAGGESMLLRSPDWSILGAMLGTIAFFILGLADDLLSLTPLSRLLVQFAIAGLAWGFGVRAALPVPDVLPVSGIDDWFSLLVTAIWLVGVVNAINWIDGLDGLAAGVSGIAALGIAAIALADSHPTIALLALALAGGTLGFLRYNFNPAKIFMGDGGSYFLGFALASLCVLEFAAPTDRPLDLLLPFAILAIPIFDMAFVILSRLRDGQSPFRADQRHIHHRLLATGISQRVAAACLYSWGLLGSSAALALAEVPGWPVACVVSSIAAIALSLQLNQERLNNRIEGGQNG